MAKKSNEIKPAPRFLKNSNPEIFQGAANVTSVARAAGGLLIGTYVALHPEAHSMTIAAEVGVLAFSDKVDGWLGKLAARIRRVKDKVGQKLDPLMDKWAMHAMMIGLGVQSFREGNIALGSAIASSEVALMVRDKWVSDERAIAASENKNASSPMYTRLKTVGQFAVVTAAMSTYNVPEHTPELVGGFVGTTVYALGSGIKCVQDMRNAEPLPIIPTEIAA